MICRLLAERKRNLARSWGLGRFDRTLARGNSRQLKARVANRPQLRTFLCSSSMRMKGLQTFPRLLSAIYLSGGAVEQKLATHARAGLWLPQRGLFTAAEACDRTQGTAAQGILCMKAACVTAERHAFSCTQQRWMAAPKRKASCWKTRQSCVYTNDCLLSEKHEQCKLSTCFFL